MVQKLWAKNVQVDHELEAFSVGKDREMDLYLARSDLLGSMAHITMLELIGLLYKEDRDPLLLDLKKFAPPSARHQNPAYCRNHYR